ncbi:unnamed protein product [Linum trigynum]|uniref:Reverse transcriptase zinc-binding domain-containing protein n=1 Tax=Linum trigynum TaxID=586398 RepID=A0AAV2F903_9ROSI
MQGPIDRVSEASKDRWKWLWSLSIPPKLKIFIWRIFRGALASKENLHARKFSPSMTCPLCAHPSESIHHCLFTCPHAAEGWRQEWPSLPTPASCTLFMAWLTSLVPRFLILSIQKIIFLLWQTWKARNKQIFKNTSPWPPVTIAKAALAHHQWTSCPKKPPTATFPAQSTPTPNHSSSPPSSHDFEIHCDGSFFSDPQEAAYGVVVLNSHGQVCDGKAEILHCFPPLEAEAKALLVGYRLATDLHSPGLVCSDCLPLVKAMQDHPRKWPWRAAAWISTIKQMMDSNPLIRVSHIGRKSNVKANWVARSFYNK